MPTTAVLVDPMTRSSGGRIGRRVWNISGGRHAARPRLEWLGERTLLSTWTVTSLGDTGTGSAIGRPAVLHQRG